MKLADVIKSLDQVQINKAFIDALEKFYGASFPDEVKRAASISSETVFYDDLPILRGLSNDEVMNASAELSVDFAYNHLLPLFDTGDNDYIVFDTKEKCWYLFNIVDETKFKKASKLSHYLG
jgi:hypothetical protein